MKKENVGWMMLVEKSMKGIWDNKKDEEIWNKYMVNENNQIGSFK